MEKYVKTGVVLEIRRLQVVFCLYHMVINDNVVTN